MKKAAHWFAVQVSDTTMLQQGPKAGSKKKSSETLRLQLLLLFGVFITS
jgi:hypothetical protein